MPDKIRIKIGGETRIAGLNGSSTAHAFAERLPLKISMSRWGEEYYGNCGLSTALENGAREEMAIGELAFWPQGSALCIFFGPTPASIDTEPRAVSPVNPIGMIEGDIAFLKKLPASIDVEVEALD
jgi:hypothetical protein